MRPPLICGQENPWRDTVERPQYFDNHIRGCGTAGIRSLLANMGTLWSRIHHCGWQEAEYYFECAGENY